VIKWIAKALQSMRHSGGGAFSMGTLARTRVDFKREVGSGIDSSVVTAPVQWIQRAVPEARLRVVRRRRGEREEVEGHALTQLLGRPNPHYGDIHLWGATVFSWCAAGNAYWVVARNRAGRPAELWYVPHWLMTPKWPQDGSAFISHYEYNPGGERIRLEPEEVVHFRAGVDPRNPRLGLSPLHGAIREIFGDLEASNFVAALLRNMGVPGVVISPEGGAQAAPEDVEAVKTWFREAFGGDRRGDPLVMGGATKVQPYGFSPQQMDLSVVRDVAEERVCACLGIPAAVVGFGAGLQQTKVGATMKELRREAWTGGVLPILRGLADEVERSLLPLYGRHEGLSVEHDLSAVAALDEDQEARARRWSTLVQGGIATVAEGRRGVGLDAQPADEVYLRPFSAIEVPAGQRQAPPAQENALRLDLGWAKTKHGDGHEGHAHERRTATAGQRAYVRALERMERPLASAMEARLQRFFAALGSEAGAAARALREEIAAELEAPELAATAGGETKSDAILVGRILEQLELPLHVTTFQRLYEEHYLQVGREVARAGRLIGLATDLPDPVARAIAAAGGRRAGLVDLSSQSRSALFDALAQGRAEGLGAEQLADRIVAHVEGGHWQSAETRSRVIARTETKYAQNTSTVARAQAAGVQRFLVFDGRLGPDRSDPEHIARDGIVVGADEAATMAAEEHPNGTLSFSPVIEEEGNDG